MRRSGGTGDALADGLLTGGGVIDVNGGILEAGGENAGEVFVIFDQENIGGTVAVMKDAG